MPSTPEQIMDYAASLPEGGLLHPKALLHLGSRAAIDQALSRLAKQEGSCEYATAYTCFL